MSRERACLDIDGIQVRIVELAYCAHCGRPAVYTATGWHHASSAEDVA